MIIIPHSHLSSSVVLLKGMATQGCESLSTVELSKEKKLSTAASEGDTYQAVIVSCEVAKEPPGVGE